MSFKTQMDRAGHLEKCKSKLWFETEDAATHAAQNSERKYGVGFYFYHCPFCRLYHISKKFYTRSKVVELWRQEIEWQEKAKKK